MKMIGRKEGKYLVFELCGIDKGTVKYDLSTGEYIGKRGGRVKTLDTQLKNYSSIDIINSFEDERYRLFLNKVYDSESRARRGYGRQLSVNIFLRAINTYSNYEQFYSAGLKKVNLKNKNITIGEVPKRLIKICKEEDITLNDNIITLYKSSKEVIDIIYEAKDDLLYLTLADFVGDTSSNGSYYYYRFSSIIETILMMVNKFGYNGKSLVKYIDKVMYFEAVPSIRDVLTLLSDYAEMSSKMSSKYEKYPKYLKTTHDIVVRNFNRFKQEFNESEFGRVYEKYKELECEIDGFSFILPKSTQDIKDEAVQQSNCVASYIDSVIEGRNLIMFMRDSKTKELSYITLQISLSANMVVQQKRRFNYETKDSDNVIIDKFNTHIQKLLTK